jgi:hypothetical protein
MFQRLSLALFFGFTALGPPARCAAADPAAPDHPPLRAWIQKLASDTASERLAALQSREAAWPSGALAAIVLRETAEQDADPHVRRAALATLDRLTEAAMGAWMDALSRLPTSSDELHRDLHRRIGWSESLAYGHFSALFALRLESVTSPQNRDEVEANLLTLLPLVLTSPALASELSGLDVLLVDRAVRGTARTREQALSGLVLLAVAALRDAGLAVSTRETPVGRRFVAHLASLLADERLWARELAIALLGGLAASTPDTLDLLISAIERVSKAPPPEEGRDPVVAVLRALGRHGANARGAVPFVRSLGGRQLALSSLTLVRLGETKDLLPEDPVQYLERWTGRELRDGEDLGPLWEYAWPIVAIADWDPALVAPCRPVLWSLARDLDPSDPRVSFALWTLGSLGPLSAKEEVFVRTLLESKADHAARDLLLRAGAATRESVGQLLETFGWPVGWTDPTLETVARRLGSTGCVAPLLWQGSPVDERFYTPMLRGYARSSAHAEIEVQFPRSLLAYSAREMKRIAATGLLRAMIPSEEIEAPVPAQFVLDLRLATVEALDAMGNRAAPAKSLLLPLRADLDPRLRWRVERTLNHIGQD